MLSSVEQAFVGRDEKRAPLKKPAWEARYDMKNYNQTCICKWSPHLQSMAELNKILHMQDRF